MIKISDIDSEAKIEISRMGNSSISHDQRRAAAARLGDLVILRTRSNEPSYLSHIERLLKGHSL